MIGSRNLLDVWTKPVVSASEPKLLGTSAQLHVRIDLGHFAPRDAHATPAPQPGSDPPDPPGALAPDSGTAKDRDHLEVLAGRALERDVIDLAATPPLRVEKLMVEQVEAEVDRLAQFCPTFVRIISGMALTAITMITTRYTIPSVLAMRPFVYSRM